MASENDVDHVWKLIKKIGFCMLSTRDGDDIRARPMSAYADRNANAIYFFTDVNGFKDDEIRKNPNVCLAFADAGDQNYVSVTGRAEVTNDRAKINELFSTPVKAWFKGPDDPNIRLLKVYLKDAQYWDSPGTIVSYVKMIAAALSDNQKPAVGEHAKVGL